MNYSMSGDKAGSIISIFGIILCISLPVVVARILYVNRYGTDFEYFKLQFGTLT